MLVNSSSSKQIKNPLENIDDRPPLISGQSITSHNSSDNSSYDESASEEASQSSVKEKKKLKENQKIS